LARELLCIGRETPVKPNMTLMIEKSFDGHITTIRLIGRIQSEHLEELKTQIGRNGSRLVLDLEEVSLIDAVAVRFLGSCQAQGVTLLNCSPYIRDWIAKERDPEK
jgi:anti-anti-sigma regulatory factor